MPLFHRPADVAATLDSSAATSPDPWQRWSDRSLASDIRGGTALARGAVSAADTVGSGALRAGRGLERLLAPAGRPLLDAAGSVANWLYAHPAVAVRLGAGAMAAPIIAADFVPEASHQTEQILRSYDDPERVVNTERVTMASLNEFLEKKAAARGAPDALELLRSGMISGVAKGVGNGLVDALGSGVGRLFGAAKDAILTNPRRKALLQKLLDSDPVISDAVRRNSAMTETILEAYGTMLRYAPSLTEDVNAVRSFLREVILGGGHVNYATIKNLIETEKAHTGLGSSGKRG